MKRGKGSLKQGDAVSVPVERVEQAVLVIRGQKVLLDSDLAELYGVTVARLNEAVKRNIDRFPADFMFRLTEREHKSLISQFAISNVSKRGGRRFAPYMRLRNFCAVMLASILNSPIAVAASIQVVRAPFVRLRQLLASNESFRRKLAAMERKLEDHDEKFGAVFEAIRQLMDEDEEEAGKSRIGFESESEG